MTLAFVDPAEQATTFRVCLWAAPGEGKSVAAASAPGPILVVSADRPSAYVFARRHFEGKDIRETRYLDQSTFEMVSKYLQTEEGLQVRTVVLDPVSNVYDHLVDSAPKRQDGEPDYVVVNKKLLGFVRGLRSIDVNVVLVAHERLSDSKRGDGKLYPAIGGPALINKVLAEMDIVAHIERYQRQGDDGELSDVQWIAQIQPVGNLVGKDSTDALGDRRVADLSRWFELANEANGVVASVGPRKPSSDVSMPEVDQSPYVGDSDHAEPYIDRGGKDTREQNPTLKQAAKGLKWSAIKEAYVVAGLTPPEYARDAFKEDFDGQQVSDLEATLRNRRFHDLEPTDIPYALEDLAPTRKGVDSDGEPTDDLPWSPNYPDPEALPLGAAEIDQELDPADLAEARAKLAELDEK